MGVVLSNVAVTPSVLAVGEAGVATFTVTNTGSKTITSIYPYLNYPESALGADSYFVRSMSLGFEGIDGISTSIAKNGAKTFSFPFTVEEHMRFSLEEYSKHSVALRIRIMADDSPFEYYEAETEAMATLLDMRYEPAILEYTVSRVPTDESAQAQTHVKCSLSEGAAVENVALTLQWREAGSEAFPEGNRLAVDVESALAGVWTEIPGTFEQGMAYEFRATMTDGFDSAMSQTILAKSFANLHLSGSGYGVGIGQYSTGTEEEPKFECQYPAYFYGGIAWGWEQTTRRERRPRATGGWMGRPFIGMSMRTRRLWPRTRRIVFLRSRIWSAFSKSKGGGGAGFTIML